MPHRGRKKWEKSALPSCHDQPNQEQAGNPEEDLRNKLILAMLFTTYSWGWTSITKVERGCKQSKWEGTNSERHVESSIAKSKRWKGPSIVLWFRSLSRWARGQLVSWVLFRSTSAIQRNHLVSTNSSLAYWAHLSVGSCLQPLVQAGPAEQVTTEADNSILGCVQADVALEIALLTPRVSFVASRS